MIAQYGAANGFNWKMGDIIGLQIVEVRHEPILQRAFGGVLTTVGSLTCVFILTSAIFLLLLRRYVTRPLKRITDVAQSLSLSAGAVMPQTGLELDGQFHDLERSITRLKTSLDEATRVIRTHSSAEV
jgi:protein-histidine pros-kinase